MEGQNIKPRVFPTQEQQSTISEADRISAFDAEKAQATHDIYIQSQAKPQSQDEAPNNYNVHNHTDAVEAMRLRTEQQMVLNKSGIQIQDPSLAEKTSERPRVVQQDNEQIRMRDEQIRMRDEQLRINNENIQNYQHMANEASARNNQNPETNSGLYTPNQPRQNMEQNTQQNVQAPINNYNNNYVPPTPPSQPPTNNGQSFGQNPSNINPYIQEISQPNYNGPFDVIPLPSKGRLYPSKKANIRVGFMTTADENILTSPNLMASGEFLEILINRKILEPELRYKDLTVGDRNAIMLWLRATAYGHMYPVTILDEKGMPFDTDINLNELKTKESPIEPDAEGLFSFTLPLSRKNLKLKVLTCGDVDDIERIVKADEEAGIPVDNSSIYTLERLIIEVDGDRNKAIIKDFVNSIRIGDGKALSEYMTSIESGIDLNISVQTPGGGSISTFLPLNVRFFWPNL